MNTSRIKKYNYENCRNIRKSGILFGVAIFVLFSFLGNAIAQQSEEAQIQPLPSTLFLPKNFIDKYESEIPVGIVPWATSSSWNVAELKHPLELEYMELMSTSMQPAIARQSSPQILAESYLTRAAENLGIADSATQMIVKQVNHSLSGVFVEFEQRLNGLPILEKQVLVGMSPKGSIQSVFRNVVQVPNGKTLPIKSIPEVSEEGALNIAWNDLSATGALLENPTVNRAYVNENNVLTLAYVIQMAIQEPFGYWEHWVDATTGRIIYRADRASHSVQIKRLAKDSESVGSRTTLSASNLDAALQNFERIQTKRQRELENYRANGKPAKSFGLVFDSNPISITGNTGLIDDSPPAQFNGAYSRVALEDITKLNGKLHLWGPIVRIEDFEPGDQDRHIVPSTETTEWSARRGNNAFNDVMTFYILHKSIKYLHELGYTDDRDLFLDGISADSDGVRGADNSHYVPDKNRLAFGHGCVDDNEDSDVILHELGHAITYRINESWRGGDARAIGEGFGDYWAFSYRLRNNMLIKEFEGKVFVWDAIPECWSGRRVDQFQALYDENMSYRDHQLIEGTFYSDELWSTPLAQSLIELSQMGETPESVDIVVLEGMFGIGSNFSMRQLAVLTVERAKVLYPERPHSSVLEANFIKHNILTEHNN